MKQLNDIGMISKAHGFFGEVLCLIDDGRSIPGTARFIFLELEGAPVPFLIERRSEKNDSLVLKLEDVSDEAAARKLAGLRIFIEHGEYEEDDAELDWKMLVGYEAIDSKHGSLGKILSVENFPGQMIARCNINGKEAMFPLAEDLVTDIDQEKKTLFLNLPDGLLDIYLGG